MSLNLNILKSQANSTKYTNIVYRDLHLDIEKLYTNNDELHKINEITDIVTDVNSKAIKNSIYNILSTMPGQKILNPEFGLNLTQWLFTNLSETNASLIKFKITEQINRYEPRVTLTKVEVVPNYEEHQYDITIQFNNNETFNLNLTETGIIPN
nr:MAG TPA: Baseplate wedge protein [Caudoviricetes sp.]